ncbi:MAG: hypothetical protein P8Y36_04815, partial [Alphaproteobacteria bacterium]
MGQHHQKYRNGEGLDGYFRRLRPCEEKRRYRIAGHFVDYAGAGGHTCFEHRFGFDGGREKASQEAAACLFATKG